MESLRTIAHFMGLRFQSHMQALIPDINCWLYFDASVHGLALDSGYTCYRINVCVCLGAWSHRHPKCEACRFSFWAVTSEGDQWKLVYCWQDCMCPLRLSHLRMFKNRPSQSAIKIILDSECSFYAAPLPHCFSRQYCARASITEFSSFNKLWIVCVVWARMNVCIVCNYFAINLRWNKLPFSFCRTTN